MSKTSLITSDTLRQIFLKHDLGEVINIKELHGGYANPAFLINNIYVIRFNSDVKQDRKDCFLRENILYSLFAELDIPAPRAIAVNVEKDIVPAYYIINSYIPGDILSSVYASFTVGEQRTIVFEMGKLLKKIHTVQLDLIGDNATLFNWKSPWKETFIHTFDQTYREFNDHGNYLSEEDRKAIKEIYDQFIEQIHEDNLPIGLIHNDFHANHIVVDGNKITGVIDFEWSSYGDPLYDMQKLPINFSINGEFDVKNFLEGYGVPTFNEKERLRFRVYCIEQAIWMIDRTRHGEHGFPKEGIEQGYNLIKSIYKI